MGTRIGFVASEKGAEKECDVGLGLRMQTNDTKSLSSRKMMMMMMSHHHHHDSNEDDDDDDVVVDDEPPLYNNRAFGEEGCALGGAAGRGGGGTTADGRNDGGPSLFCNTSNHINHNNNSNQVVSMANIFNLVGSDSGSLLPKTLLIPNSETFYNPSGGIMVNANVRVPFTADQRQELERQTMIYKYMMASVPVPHQLLTPFIKSPSNFAYLHSNRVKGALELGMSNSSDQEPWRCRRTDGKKWRCSRNVIPDQKYCERHSHKSRPRSRKHVELQSHFFNNNTTTTTTTTATTNSNNTRNPYSKPDFLDHQRKNHQSPFSNSVVSSTATTTSSHDQPRNMEWFMNSNQEWQHMIHAKQNVDMPKQTNERERALELYNSQGLQQSQGLNDQFSLLLDHKLTPLGGGVMDSDQTNKTRHFIDAWSTAERDHLSEICHSNRYSNSSNDKLPFSSSLALSIHGGNNQSSEVSQNAQMGFGSFLGSGRESEGDVSKSSQWMMMNNPVSWSGSLPPGGPLAEALCLGMSGSTRPPLSRGSS